MKVYFYYTGGFQNEGKGLLFFTDKGFKQGNWRSLKKEKVRMEERLLDSILLLAYIVATFVIFARLDREDK